MPSLKLQSIGASDIWIAKYNARNQLVWARKAGGKGKDVAESIALSSVKYPANAAYRDVYITGTIQACPPHTAASHPPLARCARLAGIGPRPWSEVGVLSAGQGLVRHHKHCERAVVADQVALHHQVQ